MHETMAAHLVRTHDLNLCVWSNESRLPLSMAISPFTPRGPPLAPLLAANFQMVPSGQGCARHGSRPCSRKNMSAQPQARPWDADPPQRPLAFLQHCGTRRWRPPLGRGGRACGLPCPTSVSSSPFIPQRGGSHEHVHQSSRIFHLLLSES